MRVSGTDEERREQYADDRHYISDEFCCLESSFGFVTTLGWHASGLSVTPIGVDAAGRCAAVGLSVVM